MSLPQLIPLGHLGTNTTCQPVRLQGLSVLKEGCRSLFRNPSWLSLCVHPQAWHGLSAPAASQRVSLKAKLVERQGIWRNVFLQVGLSQKQHTTAILSIINWKKYQKNAEVHSLWLGRDLNLCLYQEDVCYSGLSFCTPSKKEADAIKAMYWLASLKPAAAAKKVSCRTTSRAASSFRQAWWKGEINPRFQCFADSASFRQTMLRWGHEAVYGERTGCEEEEGQNMRKLEEKLSLFSTPHTTSTLPCWASAIWFPRWGFGVSSLLPLLPKCNTSLCHLCRRAG